uniref:uncharacterized protein lsp1a n=1 Tax=Centroberyx gerrardi TaxID=166262 RepID=UPI003AADCAD7
MSSAIVRRNSSKQGLQNLMRVTAQRSIEDAEEAERERRRRAREAFRRTNSGSAPGEPAQENGSLAEDGLFDGSLKPSSSPSLEEDEGFSDWTQRREKRRQQRLQELSQGAEEEEEEEEEKHTNTMNGAVPEKSVLASASASSSFSSSTSSARLHRQQQVEVDKARTAAERRKEREEEEALRADRARREEERKEEEQKKRAEQMKRAEQKKREEHMRTANRREEIRMPDEEVEKRREVKVSYTSKVFLQQEAKHSNSNGDADEEEVTSHNKTKRSTSRAVEMDEAEAILETEQRLEKIRRSHQQKESQELEQLRHRQAEAEQELEELKRRREERRRVRDEEERRREEEEQQRLAKEEEERRRMKEDIERRRMEAAERMKSLSSSGVEGDETFSPFSPKAPTHKRANEEGLTAESAYSITERTESLNRSLKKSNSFKKTQPPVLLSKIDDKLEQYAHAVENAQEAKAAKAGPADLPGSPEVVASKKNLFEAGEAWSQSPTKGPTKEAEGLKVGVADLITHWVKGSPDGSRQAAAKPADVKPGDVMQKRNMWEIIGDSSGRPGQRARGSASGKRYKFIVTGHGKYEKISIDDENEDEFTDGKSAL